MEFAICSSFGPKNIDFALMDEVGKMELFSKEVERELEFQLKNRSKILGTIPDKWNHWLIDEIRQNCEVIEVTKQNRDHLAVDLINKFNNK